MKHYRYRVEPDEDPESPREWDNVGTMVCWHRRHHLGDEQPSVEAGEYLCELARRDAAFDKVDTAFDKIVAGASQEAVMRYRDKWLKAREAALSRQYVRLPLYLYDHSGITMNTTGFSCPWDSGQVGFIYCSLKKAQEEFGTVGDKKGFKALVEYEGKTMTLEERAELCLKGEVKVYDQFISGEVYWWCVESCEAEEGQDLDEVEDWETLESCGGCYGRRYAEQEAQQALEYRKQESAVFA